jgi:hypothetical protein
MTVDERIIQDTEFLADLLIDPNIINGELSQCTAEVGKKALDIYYRFEENPTKITFGDIQDLVTSTDSQIGHPGPYLAHILNTGGVFRSLVKTLEKIHPTLKLPHPNVAFATGLIHDLNATFSDYSVGSQQSKEFDQFILAKRLGWKKVADDVSLHSDYLGGIRLMAADVDFPKKKAYKAMTEMLKGDGPLSYTAIAKKFKRYIEGKDRLCLMLLTVADYSENGKPYFNLPHFNADFNDRTQDILWRYYGKAQSEGKVPSLLGQALANGGIERIETYKNIVSVLLNDDKIEVEKLKEETTFFN